MIFQVALRRLGAACCALLLAACGSVQPEAPQQKVAAVTSADEANARLAQVAAERAAIEARFAARQAECYDKFFVNRCLDQAAEQRRTALAVQHEIEIDAARFLRRLKVEERDRALAEAEKAFREEEARLAADPPPVREPADTALPPPRPSTLQERRARNAAKTRADAARERAEASERAEKARQFEQRRIKSEQRQKEVARRVAERKAKAAREAQKAAPAQPATRPVDATPPGK